jgi:hypothetical protein
MRDDALATYPPLNTLKRMADNLWIVDGPVTRFGLPWPKFPFPTRMTLVRLSPGALFAHFADKSQTLVAGRDQTGGRGALHCRAEPHSLLVDSGMESRFSRCRRLFRATHQGTGEGAHRLRRSAAANGRRLSMGRGTRHAAGRRQLYDRGRILSRHTYRPVSGPWQILRHRRMSSRYWGKADIAFSRSFALCNNHYVTLKNR